VCPIKGNLTFVDNGGMNMVWTRNRQAESEGKATREQWSKVGTPIQPLPFELKKLQPLIGEWDSEIGPNEIVHRRILAFMRVADFEYPRRFDG